MNKTGILVSALLLLCSARGQEINCNAHMDSGVLTSTCTASDGYRSRLICASGGCSLESWYEPDPHQAEWDLKFQNEMAGYRFAGGKWVKCIEWEGDGKCHVIALAQTIDDCDKECTVSGNKPDAKCQKDCVGRVANDQQRTRLEEQLAATCAQQCTGPIVGTLCTNPCEARLAKQLGLTDTDEWLQRMIDQRYLRESQKSSTPAAK